MCSLLSYSWSTPMFIMLDKALNANTNVCLWLYLNYCRLHEQYKLNISYKINCQNNNEYTCIRIREAPLKLCFNNTNVLDYNDILSAIYSLCIFVMNSNLPLFVQFFQYKVEFCLTFTQRLTFLPQFIIIYHGV